MHLARRAMLLGGLSSGALATANAFAKPPSWEAIARRNAGILDHPGVCVGIVHEDKLVATASYGQRHKEWGGQITDGTVFRIASITKPLVSMALLSLWEERKLSLDDPLTKHLPEAAELLYPKNDRNRTPITLRHIVSHTSGIPRLPTRALTEEGALLALKKLPLDFSPGTKIAYSNYAVGLLGPIFRRVTGRPFREVMRARVFSPLAMTHTYWAMADVDRKILAYGHELDKEAAKLDASKGKGERQPGERRKFKQAKGEWLMGALEAYGGLYTTVADLAKVVRFQLAAYRYPELPGPLRAETVQLSHRLAMPSLMGPSRYGIGWQICLDDKQRMRVEHAGATDEYSGSVMMLPSHQLGVIVLSNASWPGEAEWLARRILAESVKKAG